MTAAAQLGPRGEMLWHGHRKPGRLVAIVFRVLSFGYDDGAGR